MIFFHACKQFHVSLWNAAHTLNEKASLGTALMRLCAEEPLQVALLHLIRLCHACRLGEGQTGWTLASERAGIVIIVALVKLLRLQRPHERSFWRASDGAQNQGIPGNSRDTIPNCPLYYACAWAFLCGVSARKPPPIVEQTRRFPKGLRYSRDVVTGIRPTSPDRGQEIAPIAHLFQHRLSLADTSFCLNARVPALLHRQPPGSHGSAVPKC